MAVFASDGLPRRWGVLTRLKAALFTAHPAGTLREAAFRAAIHLEAV